ncbi:RING U-box [Parachaetomium inaequale]|uniref:RING-type E3 ubiquitin transferase n=1 Tax=Parachaetomium inaequale TaxID=2588326 RepID=A0AAN6PF24_9PEZI|nr:RING U-box [Parachaetomium inaequale]
MDREPSPKEAAFSVQPPLDHTTKHCVICLDSVAEPCEAQPCRHGHFDYLCLVTWLQQRATCPICNSTVGQVRYELSEDGKEGKLYEVPANESGTQGQQGSSSSSGNHAGRLTRTRPYEDEAVRRRRLVYRHRLFSLRVGSNRRQPAASRYRKLTPQLFKTNPELLSRARMWLRRELRVFRFLHPDSDANAPLDVAADSAGQCRPTKAEFLEEYVLAILRTLDTQGSTGQAEEMIQEFLGRDHTRLFLHELRTWLRSPYQTLREWDRVVQYARRADASWIAPQTPEDHDAPVHLRSRLRD